MLALAWVWIKDNLKYLVIAGCVAVAAWFLWDYVSKSAEIATYKVQVEQQQLTIAQKEREIAITRLTSDLKENTIIARDQRIVLLEESMNEILKDLGDDVNDPAAKSLRELFRRLNK